MQPDTGHDRVSANHHDPGAPDAALRDASRGQRLQRVLADAGVASRRACEQMIEAGRVRVNGTIVRTLPAWVDPSRDAIRVDGALLPRPEPHLYIMLNKPARMLATPREGTDDARKSALDLVRHPLSTRLFPAGRLDFEATGLLLLTNDGDLAHRLTHARFGVEKTYQMVVRGTIDDAELARVQEALARMLRTLPASVESDARDWTGSSRPARPSTRKPGPKNARAGSENVSRSSTPPDLVAIARESGRTVLEMVARDARAGDVREALAALGHPVKSMERVGIGPLRLRGVAVGHWRELERHELIDLRRVAAGKLPRSGATLAQEDHPKIAKRFRGIGKPLTADQPARPRARGGGRPPSPARGPARTATPGTTQGTTPGEARGVDARRGRGEGVNAKRRKTKKASPTNRGDDRPIGARKSQRPGKPAGVRGSIGGAGRSGSKPSGRGRSSEKRR